MTNRRFKPVLEVELLLLAVCCLLVAVGLLFAKLKIAAGLVAAIGLVLALFELAITWSRRSNGPD